MSSGHNIPQASVRPLVRPVIMTAGKQEPEPDIKPPAASKSLSVVHKGIDIFLYIITLFSGIGAMFGIQ